MLRIGIDIGGTFTDFVVLDPGNGKITTFKLLSDPTNPATTVLNGLNRILSSETAQIIHGSTVATNALLERNGARTALVTTRGFKDVIQIGRQNRPNLYDWFARPDPALIPPELRMEIAERVDYQGNVLIPLDSSQLDEIIHSLHKNNVESVAVCLLFSFLHPQHEQTIAGALRRSGYFVSTSSEILPEFREYERTSTTAVNAYVSPILDRYLTRLETSLPDSNLQIMQSNGGMISIKEAKNNGVRCILSGPAGGIVGAQNIAENIHINHQESHLDQRIKLITFDMGGTSTDVSLIDGQPGLTTEAVVGGCPIHLPLLDIHTIGAGGGSLAYLDPGGSLHVGPQSAGAYPGPACYGRGELPTVTDANLVLGRLLPDYFLGGEMQIYPERAYEALSKLGEAMNLSPAQAAYGVIKVVNAQMERALRVISVERGYDPRDFSLFSFGGAGGLHAAELAYHMAIPKVIISKIASTLSAYGMLASKVIKDYVKTVMLTGEVDTQKIQAHYALMEKRGRSDVMNEGISPELIEVVRTMDIRYSGQSYELNIPYSKNYLSDFRQAHNLTYGYAYPDKDVEIVNLRVRAIGTVPPISQPKIDKRPVNSKLIPMDHQPVEMNAGSITIPIYDYDDLFPGAILKGPALIVSTDTTILINENDEAMIDDYQNLIIDINHGDHLLS